MSTQRTTRQTVSVEVDCTPSAVARSNSREPNKRGRQSKAISDNEDVLSFLREMKIEMRTNFLSINTKIDDIIRAVDTLKAENQSLKRENAEMKDMLKSLMSKTNRFECHSRRNNLRFFGD